MEGWTLRSRGHYNRWHGDAHEKFLATKEYRAGSRSVLRDALIEVEQGRGNGIPSHGLVRAIVALGLVEFGEDAELAGRRLPSEG